MIEIQVYINGDIDTSAIAFTGRSRKLVSADVVKVNSKTLWVKLEDGHVIKRKKGRDY
jgi:ribosome-associated protein YbcJ (S4-like RNA binding protein)